MSLKAHLLQSVSVGPDSVDSLGSHVLSRCLYQRSEPFHRRANELNLNIVDTDAVLE